MPNRRPASAPPSSACPGSAPTRRRPASDPVLGTASPGTHASAMATIPEIEVVAGCDIFPAARDQFVERWGTVWPGVRVYEDYRELFAKEQVDLVSIVTPDNLHGAVLDRRARRPARKAIFCDKPLSISLDEADRMVHGRPRGRRPDERQLRPALVPRVRRGAAAGPGGRDRRAGPGAARIGRAAGDAVADPHPRDRPAHVLRRRGAGLGLGRAGARHGGLRHRVQGRRRPDGVAGAGRQRLHHVSQNGVARLPHRLEARSRRTWSCTSIGTEGADRARRRGLAGHPDAASATAGCPTPDLPNPASEPVVAAVQRGRACRPPSASCSGACETGTPTISAPARRRAGRSRSPTRSCSPPAQGNVRVAGHAAAVGQ